MSLPSNDFLFEGSKDRPGKKAILHAQNIAAIQRGVKHLMKAYQDFLATDNGATFMDGFFVSHNFHKQLILQMERRMGIDSNVRQVAAETFSDALEPPKPKIETEEPPPELAQRRIITTV